MDVAKRAGVSPSTASQVLNGNKAARIGEDTRERVRAIAREMNYRPNSFARNIARKRTNTVRLYTSAHDNPFWVRVSQAVDIHTRRAGYKLWVDATLNDRWHYGPNDEVDMWPVDGAIIWSDTTATHEELFGSQSDTLPIVYLGYHGTDPYDAVLNDMYAGGRQAAEHVAERGYKRIAYLSQHYAPNFASSDLRIRAYEDVCRETGREIEHLHIPAQRIEPDFKLALERALEVASRPAHMRPNAVVCLDDVLAIGFYHGIRRAGLRVPDDIAIVGFDGSAEGQCLDLPLTSVYMPVEDMCKAVVDILVQRMRGEEGVPLQRQFFPTKLIVGATT
jgi:LacI family repressor for deo operon, udp, cdd, tsx, nupC, and nupG